MDMNASRITTPRSIGACGSSINQGGVALDSPHLVADAARLNEEGEAEATPP
jgi:hypothetical protein